MVTIILINSSGCELDRKEGDDAAEILREYANEGCLSGGDTLRILDNED
jgi:hypothetical protein